MFGTCLHKYVITDAIKDQNVLRFGIEYILLDSFLLRAGIQSNPNRFSAGFVYTIFNFDIAYSFITHHIMPTTHQISIGFQIQ